MSVWHCPRHGLVGPGGCCSDAILATVGAIPVHQEVTMTVASTDPTPTPPAPGAPDETPTPDRDALLSRVRRFLRHGPPCTDPNPKGYDRACECGMDAVADELRVRLSPSPAPPAQAGDEEPPLSGATNAQINAARLALQFAGVNLSDVVLVQALDDAMRAIPLYRHPSPRVLTDA